MKLFGQVVERISIEHLWAATIAVGIFAFLNTLPISPNDFWFHVALGRDMLTGGMLQWPDLYSYTPHGQPYVNGYALWFGEVLLYLLYLAGGAPGAILRSHGGVLCPALPGLAADAELACERGGGFPGGSPRFQKLGVSPAIIHIRPCGTDIAGDHGMPCERETRLALMFSGLDGPMGHHSRLLSDRTVADRLLAGRDGPGDAWQPGATSNGRKDANGRPADAGDGARTRAVGNSFQSARAGCGGIPVRLRQQPGEFHFRHRVAASLVCLRGGKDIPLGPAVYDRALRGYPRAGRTLGR